MPGILDNTSAQGLLGKESMDLLLRSLLLRKVVNTFAQRTEYIIDDLNRLMECFIME